MQFIHPIDYLIQNRYSCRKFLPVPIPAEITAEFSAAAQSIQNGPEGTPLHFTLITANPGDGDVLKGLGTYGSIRDPQGFLIGISPEGEGWTLDDFGYQMETLLLKATDLGLGSVWLGGSFQRSAFSQRVNLQHGQTIPAVAALGFPDPQHRSRDLSRKMVKADGRFPWEKIFFEDQPGQPLPREKAGDFAIALDMLRLSPSGHNKQPWRVIYQGGSFHFYIARTPGFSPNNLYFKLYRMTDLQRMEIGIARCHFELSAREHNLAGKWQKRDPELCAPTSGLTYLVTWVPG